MRSQVWRHALIVLVAASTVVGSLSGRVPAARAQHPSGPVTLTYWNQWTDPVQKGAMLKILHQFEKLHPGTTVHEVDISSDQTILTAITGGKPPDAATMWTIANLADWARRGAIQNLTPMIAAAHMNLSDFNKAALAITSYKGSLYGLPIDQDGRGLYINLDAFHAAGLKTFPRTMSQLLADAVKLTKKDSAGRVSQLGFNTNGLLNMVPYFNGTWYDPRSNKVTPDNPGVLQALTWEKTWVDKVGVAPFENFVTAKAHNPIGDHWIDGTEAMAIDGDWMCQLTPAYNKTLHWTVTAPPYPDGHPEWANRTFVDGGINIIPAGSPHPKEAFELLQYMSATQPQLAFNQVIGNTPTVKSADRLVTNGCMRTIIKLEEGPHADFFPTLPVSNLYSSGVTTAEDKVLRGKATPQQAMGQLKQTIQTALTGVH